MTGNFVEIKFTIDSKEKAERIAVLLLESKLAACVQIIDNVKSVFQWQGKLEKADECLCIVKSIQSQYKDIEFLIKKNHTYEVPEIICSEITEGNPEYLKWISSSLQE